MLGFIFMGLEVIVSRGVVCFDKVVCDLEGEYVGGFCRFDLKELVLFS